MIVPVLIYIAVTVLLIAGAAFFFSRALKLLTTHPPTPTPDRRPSLSEQLSDANQRAAIVEMLERQFHSSPSIDP